MSDEESAAAPSGEEHAVPAGDAAPSVEEPDEGADTDLEPAQTAGDRQQQPKKGFRQRRGWHFLSMVLLFVGSLLVPFGVLAVWSSTTISSTDRFVATMSPLATNPAIQSAVSAHVTAQLTTRLDVQAKVKSILPPKLQPLAAPIDTAVDTFIGATVSRIVTSPKFAALWDSALTVAHKSLIFVLEGPPPGKTEVAGGKVQIDLSKLVAEAQKQVAAHGLKFAQQAGRNHAGFTLFKSTSVEKVQGAYKLLNDVGDWLPVIAVALLAGGILLARSWRRALVRVGIYVVIGMVVMLVLLSVGRSIYLNAVPASTLPPPAAQAAYDTVIRFLRQACLSVLTLGLLVAIVAYFSGPARPAVFIRRGTNRVLGRVGAVGERAGVLRPGLRHWVLAARRYLWAADIILIAVLIVFVDHSSGVVEFLWVLLGVGLLLVIETIRARTPTEVAEDILAVPLAQGPGTEAVLAGAGGPGLGRGVTETVAPVTPDGPDPTPTE